MDFKIFLSISYIQSFYILAKIVINYYWKVIRFQFSSTWITPRLWYSPKQDLNCLEENPFNKTIGSISW